MTKLNGKSLPRALRSPNPLRWLALIGPGAIIASLTIGAGELIFSARAGALFGYRLLWVFALVLAFKWVLVFATARHLVLTGAHPFQRWMDLPGPRGWLPAVFFLLALMAFPIWVGFHAGTLGGLLSWLAGTETMMSGRVHFLWGMAVLGGVLLLSARGGYTTLERVQMFIVVLMLVCVSFSLIFIKPDWGALVAGMVVPRFPEYPAWSRAQAELLGRPIWVEVVTYVGVLGGSAYDYLAYSSYLRAKHWGRAAQGVASPAALRETAENLEHPDRRWLRAIWVDSVASFAAVLIFTVIFVVCGAELLGPQERLPGGTNLLRFQAEFVVFPWLQPLYFCGAFLAILGTLYGTIEVAPAILSEFAEAYAPGSGARLSGRLRRWAVAWVGLGGFGVLAWSALQSTGSAAPPRLVALLTPANLFTGVLGCGLVCVLSLWVDRVLPKALRMGRLLTGLNVAAALTFLCLGFKAYWDYGGGSALAVLGATVAAGWLGAWLGEKVTANGRE